MYKGPFTGLVVTGLLAVCLLPTMGAAAEPRARDIGIPFAGTPGPLNAITDVAGLTVGFESIIKDLPDGDRKSVV